MSSEPGEVHDFLHRLAGFRAIFLDAYEREGTQGAAIDAVSELHRSDRSSYLLLMGTDRLYSPDAMHQWVYLATEPQERERARARSHRAKRGGD